VSQCLLMLIDKTYTSYANAEDNQATNNIDNYV